MQSLLGKRVAKELHVLRYIPDRKVYEMRVEWGTDASPSTFFLSEVFLYPYSLRPQNHQQRLGPPTICTKEIASSNNDSAGIKMDTMGCNNHSLPCKIQLKHRVINESLLDYDSLVEPAVMKQTMRIKKGEIIIHHANKPVRKKRKT